MRPFAIRLAIVASMHVPNSRRRMVRGREGGREHPGGRTALLSFCCPYAFSVVSALSHFTSALSIFKGKGLSTRFFAKALALCYSRHRTTLITPALS